VRRRFFGPYLILLAVLIASALAYAQAPINLELKPFKVVVYTNEEGKQVEKLIAAEKVAPGDLLEWRLKAVNESNDKLQDVALVIPIPPKTYYVDGSAKPLTLKRGDGEKVFLPEFSYDGGKKYGRPPLYKKVIEVIDGKTVEKLVVVPPEEYTNVRWVIDYLMPGEAVEVYLRTKVR